MNRRCHRLLFNPARGLLMAVAETARSAAARGGRRADSATASAAASAAACWLLSGLAGPPALAQIVADPAAAGQHRPTVLAAPNGVPLVNITTPSAAGVSRNVYRQFDVAPAGAILNNSRSDVATAQGGWVQGNPWLAAGAARVILNEVNSRQPSELRGFVEVAGSRAEVVIANPSGIQVNGGGFLNASQVTLTTGTPQFSAGALSGYRVEQGVVSIDGLGLNTRDADATRVLARAVNVNAGLWARDLRVVAGAAEAGADASTATPRAGTGAAPAFALDVSALGGLYAGRIHLVGTEAGLGVNHAGVISAGGDLTLDARGWLTQQATARTFADSIHLRTEGIDNAHGAVIGARESLTIDTGTLLNRDGSTLLSLGDATITARDRVENRSSLIEAGGALRITTPELRNLNDTLEHTVITDPATSAVDYFTPAGVISGTDVGWVAPIRRTNTGFLAISALGRDHVVPASHAYGDPAYRAYYLGPLPYEAARTVRSGGRDSTPTLIPDAFHYDASSPVWALFGVAAPTGSPPGSRPRATEGEYGPVEPSAQAIADWEAQAAPWLALNERVLAMRSSVSAAMLSFDVWRSYTQTTSHAEMTRSAAARLVSGGAMTLQVGQTLLNQDSEVLAGGALSASAEALDNRATTVSAPTSRSGTFYSWGVVGRDCDLFDCDPVYGWQSTAYAETISRDVPLPAVRSASGQPAPLQGASAASGLFVPAADPAATVLFETDPRFTDRRQWLSSDYLLNALAIDPASVQKRLGDGYLEQQRVREQIAGLTGQRWLDDFTSDDAQYAALMAAGVTFAQAHQLRPGIALSPAQIAALTSDIVWLDTQTVTLPNGATTQALVPRVYLAPRPGDLSAGGALMAGARVQLQFSGDAHNTGTIAGRQIVQINAQNLTNTGLIDGASTGISTRQDVNNIGGTISATDALVVQAGRDLNVQTTTARGADAAGAGRYSSEQIDRVAGLYVSGEAGVLLASAGRDVNLTAAALQAGSVQVQAGHDLNLNSVNTSSHLDATRDARNIARVQQRGEVGTQIQGTTIHLQAGQDIATRAAGAQAQGDLALSAGRDVSLTAGQASYQIDHSVYAKSSGLLGSSSVETRTHHSHTQAVGTALGGHKVVIHSGQDILLSGSSSVADQRIDLSAGRDVSLTATQTHSASRHFHEEKTRGVFSSGSGITVGRQQQSTDQQTQATGAAASTVGAIGRNGGGDVNITAGRAYAQTGSDLLSPGGDLTVQAQTIAITEARTTERHTTEQRFKQSGVSLTLSSPVIDTLQGAAQTAQALGNTGDGRTQALGAAVAALQGKQVADAVKSIASDPTAAAGIGINISLGSSKSQSNSEVVREGAQGSRVIAAGDVSLIAAGASPASNVQIRGSTIEAGDTTRLKAEGDINLVAATQTTRETNRHSSQSGSIGVGISTGGATTGVSLNAGASRSKGQGSGEETTHANTHVRGGQRVELQSGANTTLRGAVVAAPAVQARIGGDLRIESLQDRATYSEQGQSASAGVSLCIPPLCYGASSVSGGAGKTAIDSTYASVTEQSAIRAGDGGFDVNVQGKTTLIGGAITSAQTAIDANRNRFDSAGGLALSDIRNEAAYQAEGHSVNASLSGQLGDQSTAKTAAEKRSAATPGRPGGSAGVGADAGSASSTTQAAISGIAGHTAARTGDAETGIAPIFDRERTRDEVRAQVAITAAFFQQAPKAWADHAGQKQQEALARGDTLEAERWGEGGAYRTAGHVLLGALGGDALGAAGALTSATVMPQIGQHINDADLPAPVKQALGMVASATLGALAGNTAGAAAAFGIDTHNRQLHPSERELARDLARKSGGRYTAQQIEDALRSAANTPERESVVTGMVVDPAQPNAIYDKGAVWTLGANGQLVQVLPPQPDAELAAFIQQHTSDTYRWSMPAPGAAASAPGSPRDPMTGRPLDAQGRYSQTVVLDGKVYEPKYHACATTECLRTGANLDMSDPATQAYVRALDAQVFKDIGTAATIGSLITPVGVGGAVLMGVGLGATTGEVALSDSPIDVATDKGIEAVSEAGAEGFIRNVLGHTPSVAARAAALINLSGGWEAFANRVKIDLLGVKPDDSRK